VDAFQLLVSEHGLTNEDVASIEVESAEQVHNTVSNRFCPASLEEARFSTPFLIAEVLIRGKVDENTYFGPEKIGDALYKKVQEKVSASVMSDLPFGYPGARVSVVKTDGQRLVKELEDRIGSPSYPLTLEQIAEVARPILGNMLNESQLVRVERIMLNLETQPDMLELMDILTFCRVYRQS